MFIGDQFLNNKEVFDLAENFSFEISLALYQKLKNKGYQIVSREGKFGVSNKSQSIFFPYTFNFERTKDNTIFFDSSDEAFSSLGRAIDHKKLATSLLFLQDFHNQKFSKTFKDKNGEEFQLELIENYGLNFDSLHTHNMMIVKRNNKKIGYLHSYYMDKENVKANFSSFSEYLLFKKRYYPKNLEELKSMSKEFLSLEDTEHLNANEFIERSNKQLLRATIFDIKNNCSKLFLNLATSFFTRLMDEEKGKGIAQIMYLETAKYYNSIGIDFRSSVCLSAEGQQLWKNLQKNFPDSVYTKTIDNKDVLIFQPDENEQFNYDDIKRKRKINP